MTAAPDVSSQPVLLEKLQAGVMTLTLNRPERLNAFNTALHEALFAGGRACGGRPRLPRGPPDRAGKGFCAGQDLTDRAAAPDGSRPDLGEAIERRYNPLVRALRRLPKPVVCAVNGAAAGAGANVALACDIVLAAKSAKFLQAFARIGLIPDSGGTWCCRVLSATPAPARSSCRRPIGAEQAEAWGMIHRAVDDQDLMGEAQTLAERLAAGPTHALGLIKRALFASPSNSLDAQSTSSAIFSAKPARRTNIARACALSWKKGRRISRASGPAHDAPADRRKIRRDDVGGRHGGAGPRHEARSDLTRRGDAVDGGDPGDDQRPRRRARRIDLPARRRRLRHACNSYNQRCVAQACSIAYLKPGREGSRLTARAREVRRVERSGVYDVSVADETGRRSRNSAA